MEFQDKHGWDVTVPEARTLQERVRAEVRVQPLDVARVSLVAGLDQSHARGDPYLYGAVVVLKLPELTVVETASARCPATFPYVPGYLSFREIPVLLAALRKLSVTPDALFVDGHGLAHPRRAGLACHLGWYVDLPVVGCAKSKLIGKHRPLENEPGASTALLDPETKEPLGAVLRTRKHAKPIFLSVGHLVDLPTATTLFYKVHDVRYRLPEPTRLAHKFVNEARKANHVFE
jgi:deoxyribonuclease V